MQGVASLGLKRVHKREANEWGYYRGVRLCLSRYFLCDEWVDVEKG